MNQTVSSSCSSHTADTHCRLAKDILREESILNALYSYILLVYKDFKVDNVYTTRNIGGEYICDSFGLSRH